MKEGYSGGVSCHVERGWHLDYGECEGMAREHEVRGGSPRRHSVLAACRQVFACRLIAANPVFNWRAHGKGQLLANRKSKLKLTRRERIVSRDKRSLPRVRRKHVAVVVCVTTDRVVHLC
jgi:hypothetical protein